MPTAAAAAVAERAGTLADAACELYDVTGTPGTWSADAVEDAVEAMETTALALLRAHPATAAAMDTVARTLALLRQDLGLPAADHGTDEHQDQAVTPTTPIRRSRTARRGLGPGFQGVRIPPGRTATGR
ncbi:hypothetical protein ACJ6WF_48225 [Streptomyces sp. MMS24-I2-30]|uniref:hypothetical protein n=1 Tax=Streptomyces sp. MMS24-I2-30 TaxID=3351564 RepID=UPI00389698C3